MGPGDVIQDRYELTEEIGRGGMAVVWKAHDRHLDRDVAIKFIDAGLAERPDFLVRFFSEAQAAARINHPNVVEVLDFGQIDDQPFLVMEFVGSGAASDHQDRSWRPEVAARVVAQAAAGAGAAHESGLVHRDIKPGNILIDDDGNAKLADFGIAAAQGAEKLTVTGTAIGSPHYISPEQATGQEASPASDVYALGAVLYGLLTGRPPFTGDNVTAIAIAHVEKEPEPPSTLNPAIPPGVEEVVLSCLAKDPRARPSDGAALAHLLHRVADEEPTAVVAARPSRPARPRKVLMAAAAALVVVGTVLAIASVSGEDGAVAAGRPNFDENKDAEPDLPKTPGTVSTGAPDDEVEPTPTPTPTADKKEPKEEDVSSFDGNGGSGNGGSGSGGNGSGEDPYQEEPPEEEPEPTPTPTPQPTEPTSAPEPTQAPSA